jgi:cytochrome b subunit of formate dehydrogenase
MDKNKIKLLVDIGMAIAFLLVVITGIFKWPRLSQTMFYWAYEFVSPKLMSRIHDWSGLIMALFVLIHLILNWIWIKSMISCMFKKEKKCDIKNGK